MQLTPEQQKAIDEQKEHCPFCKIIKGEVPSQKVFEDNDFIAVLDINPGVKGHTLLVPKEHAPILQLLPQQTQQKLGIIISQLSDALKKSILTTRVEIFIANGAAAGQQSSHFLVHLLPSETKLLTIPAGESDESKKLDTILKQRFGPKNNKEALSKAISENQELRRMIIEQPDELMKNLHAAPDIQALFQGVDIKALSQKLKEQEEPIATSMSDEQLIIFINTKDKLRDLLINNPAQLEEALTQQPKLQRFFNSTSVAAVRERYMGGKHV